MVCPLGICTVELSLQVALVIAHFPVFVSHFAPCAQSASLAHALLHAPFDASQP